MLVLVCMLLLVWGNEEEVGAAHFYLQRQYAEAKARKLYVDIVNEKAKIKKIEGVIESEMHSSNTK